MNNEIKEILDNVRKCCDITKDQSFVVYQRQDILKLLDYITNLQQEKEDYKSRCEKVQEIINTEKKLMGYAIYDSCLLLIEEALNGRSDE